MDALDYPKGMPDDWQREVRREQRRFVIGLSRLSGPRQPGAPREAPPWRGPVLLVHGASAGSRTFLSPPAGTPTVDKPGGLARYLSQAGWDVWLLDWRSSNLLVPVLIDGLQVEADGFTLEAAQHDLATAIEIIREQSGAPGKRVPVVGHCIGGALVAQAVARQDSKEGGDGGAIADGVGNIVLTTLGLFFCGGIDDWLKGNEHFLEQIWWEAHDRAGGRGPSELFVSPWAASAEFARQHPWPAALENAYQLWKETPLRHDCDNEFCWRSSFMYGMPFRIGSDDPDMNAMHDAPAPGGLWAQFGRMPLGIYMNCVENLRRGWAAPLHAPDTDRSYLDPKPFVKNRCVTMITGRENQVWHRESLDRMNEWLVNELPLGDRTRVVKHVLAGYGHQDLLWSSKAHEDVYPLINQGLSQPAPRGSVTGDRRAVGSPAPLNAPGPGRP
jgi:hypothetical protein